MVSGIGIDMVRNSRIENLIDKWGEKFLRKIFTDDELAQNSNGKNRNISYAANYAVKEAFVKALGTGFRRGIKFHNIAVKRNELGKPFIDLLGSTKKIAEQRGLTKIHTTISHDGEYSVAVVILED